MVHLFSKRKFINGLCLFLFIPFWFLWFWWFSSWFGCCYFWSCCCACRGTCSSSRCWGGRWSRTCCSARRTGRCFGLYIGQYHWPIRKAEHRLNLLGIAKTKAKYYASAIILGVINLRPDLGSFRKIASKGGIVSILSATGFLLTYLLIRIHKLTLKLYSQKDTDRTVYLSFSTRWKILSEFVTYIESFINFIETNGFFTIL